MINLELYPILLDNRKSLRETSKDTSYPNDIQYMTSSETEVVNFDLVKRHYANGFGLSEEVVTSVDAIVPFENGILFVEFKNGKVNNREIKDANCNIKLSISSVRISLETARCGLGEEGAVGDRRGQAERAGQAAKILSISASKASSGVL